ncbi:DUF1801 domain-containing protein [Tuwongella immobilis]|uniref:YdhG-like domain-containing protein n=1 Tax=Tuwongella immobilis TaxID=692036 RepID=A0A6C2YVP5_9BACT|nr:DUF1801 domain-containing protein [Tuwongella immobilis]VIP05243.1 histidine kinase : Histidine kinase OS=Afipia sp. P52-10 GN=X566_05675 PE=4 SV=1: DUF1801 [Tuwongella immobilis]VTS07842.1 histidine kinase : Histidine kinase OS=Afipia sp. P52-10 GN=X566_05675 PE=4 SV=1: DUF1801 [Tuwongella immobilis]
MANARRRQSPPKSAGAEPSAPESDSPKLLSGGNPQIAMADGETPVQAYLSAMPGWKSAVGRRLDALIVQAFPEVRKAVKWNSPFYGLPDAGWILSFHCFDKYIKVAFFQGAKMTPLPPGESKQADVRYLDIYESDSIDEPQFLDWVRQATQLPTWGTTEPARPKRNAKLRPPQQSNE